jgi:hypothetical protein
MYLYFGRMKFMYPNTIKAAFVLFFVSTIAAIISMSIDIYFAPPVLSKQAMAAFSGIAMSIFLLNVYYIYKGRNWARILWLLLLAGGIAVALLNGAPPPPHYISVYYCYFESFQIVLQTVITILLFHPDSNAWFAHRASGTRGEQNVV